MIWRFYLRRRKMTIKEAINKAKLKYNWCIVSHDSSSVRVKYKTKNGTLKKTKFDLYTDNLEQELVDLWEKLYREFECEIDAVVSVEAYGYILD